MKLKILSLLFAVGALVSACGDDDDDGTGPESTGRIRVVHLTPDAPNVDVLIDNVVVASNVAYLGSSPYLEVEAGDRDVLVRITNTTTTVVEDEVTVNDGSDYSVLVGDRLQTVSLSVLTDENDPPASDNAKVRLIHGAPGAGTVDIYVTEPGDDITLATPSLGAVDFGLVVGYEEVPAGDYQIRITPTGSKDVVIDTGTLTLSSGDIRTGIAVDAPGGGEPFDALILEDVN